MSYSRRSRYSHSPSPYKRYGRSVSRSLSRSRSRSPDSSDVENPGNNLYVTGISTRVTKRDLEKHFSTEGKVEDVHLVVDPWTRESRGFGFVTMSSLEEAERCIKYLDHSVLEGRVITVEKARRRRGRTPTPGRYLGLRTAHARRRSPSYSPYSRSRSPRYSSGRGRSRSPYYSRCPRSYSPYRRHRSYSPYYSRGRSYSRTRSPSYSRSPYSRRDRSYSPDYYRDYSPDYRYYRSRYRDYSPDDRYYRSRYRDYSPEDRCYRSRYRDYSDDRYYRSRYMDLTPDDRHYGSCYRDYSPDEHYYRRSRYRSITPPRYRRYSRRSYSHSVSPRSCSSRGASPRDYSRCVSPSPRRRNKSCSKGLRSASCGSEEFGKRAPPSRDSRSSRRHSRSPSVSFSSRCG